MYDDLTGKVLKWEKVIESNPVRRGGARVALFGREAGGRQQRSSLEQAVEIHSVLMLCGDLWAQVWVWGFRLVGVLCRQGGLSPCPRQPVVVRQARVNIDFTRMQQRSADEG